MKPQPEASLLQRLSLFSRPLTWAMVVVGLVALMWPSHDTWERWSLARTSWKTVSLDLKRRNDAAATSGDTMQIRVRSCQTLSDDNHQEAACLLRLLPNDSEMSVLPLLMLAKAWDQMLTTLPIDHPDVVRAQTLEGLLVLDSLDVAALQQKIDWNRLVEAFQANLMACQAVFPTFFCTYLLDPDAQAWSLSWGADRSVFASEGVNLPLDWSSYKRQVWNQRLVLSRQGAPSFIPHTSPVMVPDLRSRAYWRSDVVQERPVR